MKHALLALAFVAGVLVSDATAGSGFGSAQGGSGGGTALSGLGTDNRLARWDGTDTLQSSGVTLSDTDALSGIGGLTVAVGSAAAPSINFTGNTTTGLFHASSSLGFAVSGTEELRVTTSTILLGTQHVLFGASIGGETVGLQYLAAGVLRCSDADTDGVGALTRGYKVEANATANTVDTKESDGYVFTDDGTDNGNTSDNTLPAAGDGRCVRAICRQGDVNDILKLTAVGDDTIRISGAITSAAGNISCSATGGTVMLIAVSSTEWIAVAVTGTWVVSA